MREWKLVSVEEAVGKRGRQLPADPLTEFIEWCVADPEKVFAFGVFLMLLGTAFRLLRVCLK